ENPRGATLRPGCERRHNVAWKKFSLAGTSGVRVPDPCGRAKRKVRDETVSRSFHEWRRARPRRSEHVDERAAIRAGFRLEEHVTAAKQIGHRRGEMHLTSVTAQPHFASPREPLLSRNPNGAIRMGGQPIARVPIDFIQREPDAGFTREILNNYGVSPTRRALSSDPVVHRGRMDFELRREIGDTVVQDKTRESGFPPVAVSARHSASSPSLDAATCQQSTPWNYLWKRSLL